jgi:hypothetical protein
MYLVWLDPATTPAETTAVLHDTLAPTLLALEPRALTIDLDDEGAQVPPPLPPPEGENPIRAVVSIWLDTYEHRVPFEAAMRDHSSRIAGYLVTESLYRDYGGNQWAPMRDWPDGYRSPGLLTVTCMELKRGMTYEQWLDFWHNQQSPMSEAIQPRARYVRNAVARPITPDAPAFLGIVEEAWPSVEHLTDPMLFYRGEGSTDRLNENFATMIEHVGTFIDFDTMRNMTMSEWQLRSFPT